MTIVQARPRTRPHRSRLALAATVGALALTVVAGTHAVAGVHATNDITSGHVDIVNIQCPAGSTQRQLTTKIDPNPAILPTDLHNYAFVYRESSPNVTWVTTTAPAGYWRVDITSATQSTAPWVGFNFTSGCGASGSVWMSQAGTNPGMVALRNSAGTQVLSTTSGSYSLAAGAHTHFEWRFHATSKASSPSTYNVNFGFSTTPALTTQNWLQAKFVIEPGV